jgi:hypothetical protein
MPDDWHLAHRRALSILGYIKVGMFTIRAVLLCRMQVRGQFPTMIATPDREQRWTGILLVVFANTNLVCKV